MMHESRSRIQYLRCLSTLENLFASSENIKGDSDTYYALSVPARTKPRGSALKNLDDEFVRMPGANCSQILKRRNFILQ